MKSHNEFMKEVKEAASLPAQTKKALGPESDEDRAMYDDGHGKSNFAVKIANIADDALSELNEAKKK